MALFYVFLGAFYGDLILVLSFIYLFILGDINSDSFFIIQSFHDIDGWLFRDISNIEYEQSKTSLKF